MVVYKYKGGEREPAAIPADAVASEVYGQVTSLRHADFSAAPEVVLGAVRPQIDQLARLEPVLRFQPLGVVVPEQGLSAAASGFVAALQAGAAKA